MPIFPELKSDFEETFDRAEPGAEFVIIRYRDIEANLRTQLLKIIRRAGLTERLRPWVNLRSTRFTELGEVISLLPSSRDNEPTRCQLFFRLALVSIPIDLRDVCSGRRTERSGLRFGS